MAAVVFGESLAVLSHLRAPLGLELQRGAGAQAGTQAHRLKGTQAHTQAGRVSA